MNTPFKYSEAICLYVKGRISEEDAKRQENTAKEILRRLESQPGLILADEVGMGKTFVALAVAASVVLADEEHRPVVVMVPPSLKDKWQKDFELFRERCLLPEVKDKLNYSSAERAIDFLKLLDDPLDRRKSIIFLTHGAMYRALNDGWVKLAIIQRAIYRRKNINNLYRALGRIMGNLLRMTWVNSIDSSIWYKLLVTDPSKWFGILKRAINKATGEVIIDDDPIPKTIYDTLYEKLSLKDIDDVFEALKNIPFRKTTHFDDNLSTAREKINIATKELWSICIRNLQFHLPLLILDEAHHLKNAKTQFASLFQMKEAQDDVDQISNERGPLYGVFERMLFLTATPFQLGHYELCSVLDRFEGINWRSNHPPHMTRENFINKVKDLREKLDQAQISALLLDDAWGKLNKDDLKIDTIYYENADQWWIDAINTNTLTQNAQIVMTRFNQVKEKMKIAEEALKPWVIRHLKPKKLPKPFEKITRRQLFIGKSVIDEKQQVEGSGIPVDREALLYFLLATRASICNPESRPVFAEGLASSYEAFLHTRMKCEDATDLDDEDICLCQVEDIGLWYLTKLESFIREDSVKKSLSHPKVSATVNRAIELWKNGEKVLIFCHYIASGRALRQKISNEINNEILSIGAYKLGFSIDRVSEELERIGKRFFDGDSIIRKTCDDEIIQILGKYSLLNNKQGELIEVVRRYLRTPSFLVRFFPLEKELPSRDDISQMFNKTDSSGLSLRQIIENFFNFLTERCGKEDRDKYISAVNSVQTGSHAGVDVIKTYSEDEFQGDNISVLSPNVRLVNGQTKHETREKLMLTFNTPFYPEILIASSVMAEGVDLQLNCRHVIHHDLCWNPSTLEQRIGRIDRIGSKGEQSGRSIYVYIPFVSETQDEKMYRVVMDRERWFKIVMGEKFKVDTRTTEKYAERIPLPESLADELIFKLDVN